MKLIDPYLRQQLSNSSQSLTWCWLITRTDGGQIGFTSFDLPLFIAGRDYLPFTGFDAGASQQSLEKTIDSQELTGILDPSGISLEDLTSGVYEFATVKRFIISVEDIPVSFNLNPAKHLDLPPGYIAESKRLGGIGFSIKVIDYLELLNNSTVESTSKTCRCKSLGDDRCRVDLADFSYDLVITSVESNRTFSINVPFPDSHFNRGRLRFASGQNIDIYRDIGFSLGNKIILLPSPAPFNIAVGDTIKAFAGCNRTKLQCITKFHNYQNFMGEPDIPNTDLSFDSPTK